ncbi:hypothetical protein L3X38_015756 [Prunus dulcis]|uniref:Uncharacterized protein n=1 Tax=Prunus dulcis TaxID=3755 RepID=A0AAD4Z956_PRUDU|nr:hypothetical protein L3X38_015756 [Prunus dulcis]
MLCKQHSCISQTKKLSVSQVSSTFFTLKNCCHYLGVLVTGTLFRFCECATCLDQIITCNCVLLKGA